MAHCEPHHAFNAFVGESILVLDICETQPDVLLPGSAWVDAAQPLIFGLLLLCFSCQAEKLPRPRLQSQSQSQPRAPSAGNEPATPAKRSSLVVRFICGGWSLGVFQLLGRHSFTFYLFQIPAEEFQMLPGGSCILRRVPAELWANLKKSIYPDPKQPPLKLTNTA